MGASTYHGVSLELKRRFHNGLMFNGGLPYSHNIDNSTAEVFSTVTTPRRVQDFQNLSANVRVQLLITAIASPWQWFMTCLSSKPAITG